MTPAEPIVDAWNEADPTACPVCGTEMCEDKTHWPPDVEPEGEPVREAAPSAPRLTFRAASDIMAAPRAPEIVEAAVWGNCVSLLAAESGAGKTFLLLDLAAAVSAGLTWHGRRVQEGSVAYISFEGDALGLRLRALRAHGRRLENLYILRGADPLSPMIDRDRIEMPSRGELAVTEALDALRASLAEAGGPPVALVVVDTVRASMTGSEDSSESVSAYLRAVRRILAHAPGAGAILAHHSGWQDGDERRRRERGSSAWRGNIDGTLYLETSGEYDREHGERRLVLTTPKVRDGEPPAPLHLVRRRVELPELAGDDLRDGPATSCIVERDRRSHQDREAERTAAVVAEHHALDLRTLRAIVERPDMATSQDRIRLMLGIRKTLVSESLARLARAGWVTPGSRQAPYEATSTGRQVLATEATT